MAASKTVSVGEICALLAGDGQTPLTAMAISHFVKAGMPRSGRGTYDPVACMSWRIGELALREEKRKNEADKLEEAEIRVKTVKAQLDEMTLAEREGQLIPLQLFEKELAEFTGSVRAAMMNLPARIADRMEGLTVVERKLFIKEEIRRALSALAKKGDEDGDQLSLNDAGDDTAPGVSGKPAGKRQKGKAKRVPAVRTTAKRKNL